MTRFDVGAITSPATSAAAGNASPGVGNLKRTATGLNSVKTSISASMSPRMVIWKAIAIAMSATSAPISHRVNDPWENASK